MMVRSRDGARSSFSVVARLRISLSIVITAVSIISMALLSFSGASQNKVEFESKAETSAAYLGSILETPIWNYDDATIGIIGTAFFRDEDVASLRIEDQNGQVLFADRRSAKADLSRTAAVMHGDRRIGRAASPYLPWPVVALPYLLVQDGRFDGRHPRRDSHSGQLPRQGLPETSPRDSVGARRQLFRGAIDV